MQTIQIKGVKREQFGKKGAKDIRRENLIPCVIYGNGGETIHFSVEAAEAKKILYTPKTYIVVLDIDGTEVKGVMRETQFHPVKDNVLHIDFLEVNDKKPVVIEVPVKLEGHAAGVKAGGKLSLSMKRLKVKAVYTEVPEQLVINVDDLGLGKSLQVGDLHFEGLELVNAKNAVVCAVQLTRAARGAAQAAE